VTGLLGHKLLPAGEQVHGPGQNEQQQQAVAQPTAMANPRPCQDRHDQSKHQQRDDEQAEQAQHRDIHDVTSHIRQDNPVPTQIVPTVPNRRSHSKRNARVHSSNWQLAPMQEMHRYGREYLSAFRLSWHGVCASNRRVARHAHPGIILLPMSGFVQVFIHGAPPSDHITRTDESFWNVSAVLQ
jgi:hypothetical protein